ncbi:hypothetical protein ACOMHN_036503 [Nucella lapillus]
MSFSLAGCGFLGIYHIGAAACLSEHVPHLLENARFCGASAGALIASCLICGVPMDQCVDFTLRLAASSGQYPLGGWEPNINIQAILRHSIEQVLPPDAHMLCSRRLFISITSISKWKNQIISTFNTRKELIDVLMCSAYVPAFSSYTMPQFAGEYVVDGGLSDNLPVLDANTITICPWAGEHSICPQDPEGQSFPITILNMSFCPSTHNLARFKDAFFSPQPETLKNYCWQGYDDALRFVKENHLIHCGVHRVLAVLTNLEQRRSLDCQDCQDCQHSRAHAHHSQLPDIIVDQFSLGDKLEWWASRTMWLEPVKKVFNICSMPIVMPFVLFKEFIIQLFFIAYFKLNKIRNGGMSAEVIRLINSLCKPREFIWDICVFLTSKSVLEFLKCGTRVISEVFALVKSVRFTKRAACHAVCQLCGNAYAKAVGVIKGHAHEATEKEGDVESAAKKGKEREEEEDGQQPSLQSLLQQEKEAGPQAAARTDPEVLVRGEGVQSSLQELSDAMAVLVDIHADSVRMALPLPDQDPAQDPTTLLPPPHTVQVEGLGEIREVVIDPVVLAQPPKDAASSSAEAAGKAPYSGSSGGHRHPSQQAERIHQYVHRFEPLKNVMTLHYIDEHHQRHTESLFVEETPSRATSEENLALAGPGEEQAKKVRWEDQRPAQGAEEGREGVVWDRDLDREVRQLLERKLFSGQRRFEQDYEASHQRRLKLRGQREVRSDIGHFSLQLISFPEAPSPPPSSPTTTPPTPLSRASSQLSVSGEDEGGELVRSVSDASTLAGSLRKLREHKAARGLGGSVETSPPSPLCASCTSLQEPPPGGEGLATASPSTSVQSLTDEDRLPLLKSLSDTSKVTASLPELRSLGKAGGQQGGWRTSRIARATTVPFLPSGGRPESPGATCVEGTAGGSVAGPSSDVASPSRPFQGEHSQPKTGGAACQVSSGRPSRWGHEVKVKECPRRLERGRAIHGSGHQRSKLLTSLQELRVQPLPAHATTTPPPSTLTDTTTTPPPSTLTDTTSTNTTSTLTDTTSTSTDTTTPMSTSANTTSTSSDPCV